MVLKVGIHTQEGSPASEARLLRRPGRGAPSREPPIPRGAAWGSSH